MKGNYFRYFLALFIIGSLLSSSIVRADDESTFIPRPATPSVLIEIENDSAEEAEQEEQAEEQGSILDSSYLVFTAIQFADQDELDAFLKQVNEDPEAKDQFKFEQKENTDGSVVLRVEYTEQAKADKHAILFYASTEFDNKAEAEDFAENTLLIYPDIFFDSALIELANGKYDVVFGLRPTVSAQDITLKNRVISYYGAREPFTYELAENEQDRIEPAVREAFPEAYEFERESQEDGSVKVTMTPIIDNVNERNAYLNEEDRDLAPWQDVLDRLVAPYGLNYRHVIIGVALLIALIGVLLIVFR